jgi:hypothetical protein
LRISRPATRGAPGVRASVLYVRAMLSLAIVLCGLVIVARMLTSAREGGFAILPGVVLGGAMIALGMHRLALILRARGSS